MSTTKFMTATGSNRELTVKRSKENSVQIRQFDPEFQSQQAKTFFLNPSDAPALCLAILEAAGLRGRSDYMDEAMDNLANYISESRANEAGAKEQAELEALALEMFNVWLKALGDAGYPDWNGEVAELKDTWLAVARRARELRSESNGNV